MNAFVNALREENNWKLTENGADALNSTGASLVDLFATIGAMRSRSENDIIKAFSKAFSEDMLLATKMAFYARNVRGGLGERDTARAIFKFLANNYPEIMRKNIPHVPTFGRYDDLYVFVGTPVEKDMWDFIRTTLNADIVAMKTGAPVSLLGKWLKSTNTSSKESCKLGCKTAINLGMSFKQYRQILSKLRKYIKVVETQMSASKWSEVTYSSVPSRAMNIYRDAFRRNDSMRFGAYMDSVSKGEEKINSGTLYPYDIIEKYLSGYSRRIDNVLEEQWKALPNYITNNDNILVMADVSGSMNGRPMATSVGLALYFAERTTGAFHNLFMTFSGNPQLVEVKGNSLMEKVANAMRADWNMNTDLHKAFKLVLNTAVRNHVAPSDLPKAIVVVTDMEFDSSGNSRRMTFYDQMKSEFEAHGYRIPNIVFWNVSAIHDTFHANSDIKGVQLVSGQSASTFKNVLQCYGMTPYEMMVDTLSDPMYDVIKV